MEVLALLFTLTILGGILWMLAGSLNKIADSGKYPPLTLGLTALILTTIVGILFFPILIVIFEAL